MPFCNFSTRSDQAFHAFDQAAISNNHLLAASAQLREKVAQIRIGDQIHLKGYLASYSHNHGFAFKRGTSIIRTDSGNGACETIYLEDIEIVRPSMLLWRTLMYVAILGFVISVLAWMMLPFKP